VRITRLAIRDLRRYREKELELRPLTIIRGPTSPASPPAARIELALTRVTSAAAELTPWCLDGDGEARPVVAMDFTYETRTAGRTRPVENRSAAPRRCA
jgi:hypothetical protein